VDAFEPRFRSHRAPVLGTRGMVASSQPLATAAGLRVLAAGGNAADAAVATAAALNATEPHMTGLGGDCFALFYDAESRGISALNGSGRAPAALDLQRLRADGLAEALPATHAHTVTVPGACAGWCDLVERHGRLGLDAILAPAIELAEGGFPVGPMAAFVWQGSAGKLDRAPGGRDLLVDGRAPRPGELFRNPALARSLRRVAEKGAQGFYTGEIAAAIVEVVRAHGGVLSEEDLALHRSSFEEPISSAYRGLRVHECPPNGQGLAALLALNVARGLDLAAHGPLSAARLHLLIEAMRLAFDDARRAIADPAFAAVPVEALLSEEHAARRRARIDPERAHPDPRFGEPPAGSDTVYLCCVDGDGNACSFINSNYAAFGTGLVATGTGFALQNRGHNFALDPAHPNCLAPRKRPYHTIIPGLLTREDDGSLYAPFGVMGGFMQPQGHLQVVVAMADDGLDPQAALDRPRFNLLDGRADSRLAIESDVPAATLDGLAARGHRVTPVEGWGRILFGRGQIVRRDPNGVLWGGSDPRSDGCAMALL
jgi:gamma-glutamyltranspeptidase/glutathione hydrolase